MADENLLELVYRTIRYAPNAVRDEWLNIGVLLEDVQEESARRHELRRRARLIEEDAEFARVRRLHPAVDIPTLRDFCAGFDARLRGDANGGSEPFLRGP